MRVEAYFVPDSTQIIPAMCCCSWLESGEWKIPLKMKAAKYQADWRRDDFSSMTYLLQGAFRNINIASNTTETTVFTCC